MKPQRRTTVAIALNLVPFAGIAFLWFLGVLRDRIGEREGIVARWLTIVGLGTALLLAAGTIPWPELVFPTWILALSVDILVRRPRAAGPQ
jgi:hypothetical protein